MKKALFFLLACGLILLISCKDDGIPKSIAGVRWINSVEQANGYKLISILRFEEDGKYRLVPMLDMGGTIDMYEEQPGSYVYNPPKITLTPENGEVVEGLVSDNNHLVVGGLTYEKSDR